MDRENILSLIAVGLVARDSAHPDLAAGLAEAILQRYDREAVTSIRILHDARQIAADPASLHGRDH